jgi:very-short-patch-repair endonuclease
MRKRLPDYLLQLCREFRKHPTETEAMLWACLRNRLLHGYKFRRQHPIGRYIADFYCDALKLVIEVDGGIHKQSDQKRYDMIRQQEFEDQGCIVIRLSTAEVKNDLENVLINLIPSPYGRGVRGEGQ